MELTGSETGCLWLGQEIKHLYITTVFTSVFVDYAAAGGDACGAGGNNDVENVIIVVHLQRIVDVGLWLKCVEVFLIGFW